MEFLEPMLDGVGWFFGLPAVNQVLGAMIAAGFGLGAFFFQSSHRERAEKRRIARAILQEMLQTANFLLAVTTTLVEARDGSEGLRSHELNKLLPFERKIFSMLGGAIGTLSDQAAANAVAFDGTMQALERDIKEYIGLLFDVAALAPEDCGRLADRVNGALDLLSNNIAGVLDDAYGSANRIPESTRKMIVAVQSN